MTESKIDTQSPAFERQNPQNDKEIIDTLMKKLREHSPWTYAHSARVAAIAKAIGEKLQKDDTHHLQPKDIEDLKTAGHLHDIGKLQIPKDILDSKKPLTTNEKLLMHDHPRQGFELLKEKGLNRIAEIIVAHQEHTNGHTGYPRETENGNGNGNGNHERRTNGSAKLYLLQQIIQLADRIDASRTVRPYNGDTFTKPSIGESLSQLKEEFASIPDEVITLAIITHDCL